MKCYDSQKTFPCLRFTFPVYFRPLYIRPFNWRKSLTLSFTNFRRRERGCCGQITLFPPQLSISSLFSSSSPTYYYLTAFLFLVFPTKFTHVIWHIRLENYHVHRCPDLHRERLCTGRHVSCSSYRWSLFNLLPLTTTPTEVYSLWSLLFRVSGFEDGRSDVSKPLASDVSTVKNDFHLRTKCILGICS